MAVSSKTKRYDGSLRGLSCWCIISCKVSNYATRVQEKKCSPVLQLLLQKMYPVGFIKLDGVRINIIIKFAIVSPYKVKHLSTMQFYTDHNTLPEFYCSNKFLEIQLNLP